MSTIPNFSAGFWNKIKAFAKSGIVLTGGGAKILGLEQLYNDSLHLATYVAPDPEYACIVGGGKLVNDPELLGRILEQN